MTPSSLRRATLAGVCALIVLGVAWELWLAPLRPGGTLLAFKVLPLALALPSLWRGRTRTWQLWTMLILVYVCEGAVRALSDAGPSRWLATLELVLSVAVYAGLVATVRRSGGGEAPAHPVARAK
ncbi:MAG: DUF2069 domain-containing protein [Lautropia sp.]